MKAILLITLIFLSAANLPPVFIECGSSTYDLSMGQYINAIHNANRYFRLNNLQYHYYRVTNGLEPLSPIWDSLSDLENKIKEYEQ